MWNRAIFEKADVYGFLKCFISQVLIMRVVEVEKELKILTREAIEMLSRIDW